MSNSPSAESSHRVVAKALAGLLPQGGAAQLSAPLPVHGLALDAPDLLGEPVGWRVFAFREDEPVLAVDLHGPPDALEVLAVTAGAGIDKAVSLAAKAASIMAQGNYESRLIDAPELRLHALWLHGPDDRFLLLETWTADEAVEIVGQPALRTWALALATQTFSKWDNLAS